MNAPSFVRMKGDLAVSVPTDLSCITRYVLLEQEDWFDDEIRFVRRLLGPGMRVIDVDAGFGLYTMAAAQTVGPTGHVWAYEPVAETHAHLARSVRENRLSQVEPLHTFVADDAGPVRETLDARLGEPGFAEAAFVRIAAGAFGAAALTGGRRFFAEASPLVMFEVDAGAPDGLTLGGAESLAPLGYRSYVLVPGLGQLAPAGPRDGAQGRLFCCKPDRAAALEAAGLLVSAAASRAPEGVDPQALWEFLDRYPYGAALRETFRAYDAGPKAPGWPQHREALCLYAAAQDERRPAGVRLGALRKAGEILVALVREAPNVSRLQSLVRVAKELGERSLAADLVAMLLQNLRDETFSFTPEPFVAVSAVYAEMDPGEDFARWAVASLFAEQEALGASSSYFRGAGALEALETIRDLGFQSPEMERRRQLVRMRCGLQEAPEPPLSTLPRSAEHLNTEFWSATR